MLRVLLAVSHTQRQDLFKWYTLKARCAHQEATRRRHEIPHYPKKVITESYLYRALFHKGYDAFVRLGYLPMDSPYVYSTVISIKVAVKHSKVKCTCNHFNDCDMTDVTSHVPQGHQQNNKNRGIHLGLRAPGVRIRTVQATGRFTLTRTWFC